MSNDQLTVGKYKLVNCMASGQYSQVWEAIDNETTRRVAVKLLLPEALKVSEQLSSLKNEFRVGSSFEHPNIIKYHEISVKKQHAYFSMDVFACPNLKGWIYNDLQSVHVRFKRMVEQIAMALEHIHEHGWIHRDIKPDNILMNKSAEVRIIDFSLASRAAGALAKVFARKQSLVQGTRTYMAPEQILGKPLTPQTDIYNLGITLFELLTGQPPFAGSTPKDLLLRHLGEPPAEPSSINTNITPEMDRIVLRMLSKKPDQRQKKMGEFIVELRNVSVFKEEVTDAVAQTEQELAEETLKKTLGGALDSRADALRTKLGIAAPPKKKKPLPPQPQKTQKPGQPPAPVPAPGMMPMMPQPMMPQPMMPQPMMPQMMPQMMPYPMQPMPGAPIPGAPMPGANPWIAAPAAGGSPAPWTGQPVSPQAPRPAVTQPPARPAPPPVAPTAVPQVATRPAAPVPQPAAAKKPEPAAPRKPAAAPASSSPEQGIKIDDLLGFDDLPSA